MVSEAVQPLRINKSTPTSSPVKQGNGLSGIPRALTEISPMERRRNSPSWNQMTKKMIVSREGSPFDASPFGNSQRGFWQKNDATSPSRLSAGETLYEHTPSTALKARPSIEKLKQAHRVKNSAMFAREQKNEYDPTSVPVVERPLASNRPLSLQVQANSVAANGLETLRQNNPVRGHRRGESQSKIPIITPSKPVGAAEKSPSPGPSRSSPSPTKSSLSSRPLHNTLPRGFGASASFGVWEDDDDETSIVIEPPRPLRRKAKSVTFDTGPPEVNEYEMVTPVPSVASASREGSYETDEDDDEYMGYPEGHEEDSFDASLEDTDKTPVVLPDDWRLISPDTAETGLANPNDDAFALRSRETSGRRTGSLNSEGESRPLPPLPPGQMRARADSTGLTAAAERVHDAQQRTLPVPPRAAGVSKADILNMGDSSMTLEDRLQLLNVQGSPNGRQNSVDRESARLRKHGLGIDMAEDEQNQSTHDASFASLDDGFTFPHISRESVLRRVKSRNFDEEEEESFNDDVEPVRHYDIANLDPDVPIPSRETSSNFDEVVPDEMAIKREEDDEEDVVDFYSIPEIHDSQVEGFDLGHEELDREGTVIHHTFAEDEDDASVYSPEGNTAETAQSNSATDDEGPPTPRQTVDVRSSTPNDSAKGNGISLPEFSLFDDADFQSGFQSYLSQSETPPATSTEVASVQTIVKPSVTLETVGAVGRAVVAEEVVFSDVNAEVDEHEDIPSSPAGSVIRYQIYDDDEELEPEAEQEQEQEQEPESPFVPEQVATIKAPGTKLKTRPSLTPADTQTMANTRRIVSGGAPPPVPDKSPKRESLSAGYFEEVNKENQELPEEALPTNRRETFGLRVNIGEEIDLGFGLDKEFDRVIEQSKVDLYSLYSQGHTNIPRDTHTQPSRQAGAEHLVGEGYSPHRSSQELTSRTQKGYLMRQNTKVVVAKRNFSNDSSRPSTASSMNDASTPQSPNVGRKASHERTKSWTTEPWNGKIRRKSIRSGSGNTTRLSNGPVPPMPGHESAAAGLDTVMEDRSLCLDDETLTERGRLFVKVVGLKDLDLPLSQNERSYFQLTLDNGLHCVTTSWSELTHNAPIGQEFELVVLNDLEFQLTLQTKLTPPKPTSPTLTSSNRAPNSPTKSPAKKSAFRNLLSSPKKRKEAERLQKAQYEEEEQQRRLAESRAQSRLADPRNLTAWELLHTIVGQDGSFGRAYICLNNHEDKCFGRPLDVDIPIYNEWAVEDSAIASSVKSKNGGLLRRPPYQIGSLAMQLLYVPRPKGVKEEEMPKSLNAAVREMAHAEEVKRRDGEVFEGFLSQQGGDCPYWRRRFFRLQGTIFIAHHELTRQPRVKIDLAKAVKLIDDKSSLVNGDNSPTMPSTSSPTKQGKGRRKSAFGEDEEGFIFVEEGFRIRFANGEVIDFYADNSADKAKWMAALCKAVGRESSAGGAGIKSWCNAVFAEEKASGRGPPPKKETTVAAPAPPLSKSVASAVPPRRPSSADGKMQPHHHHQQPSPAKRTHRPSASVSSSPVKPRREAPLLPQPQHPFLQQQEARGLAGGQEKTSNARRGQVRSMLF